MVVHLRWCGWSRLSEVEGDEHDRQSAIATMVVDSDRGGETRAGGLVG